MPTPRSVVDQVIATYQQAAAAARSSAPRNGQVIELTAEYGDEVMVTTDVHGNRRNFDRILELADLENHPRRHLVMQEVCHGGPVYPGDGQGCMSHLMLEDIASLVVQFPGRLHFIISNHELAELTDFPILKSRRMLNLMFRCGMQELYGDAGDEMRPAMADFLASLPVAVRLPSGVFICHSIPADVPEKGFDASLLHREATERDRRESGDLFRLVWGRDFREENAAAFADRVNARLFITGHEPCSKGYATPNSRQLILDCCGENAHYVMLPIGEKELTHDDLTARVKPLLEVKG